MRGLTLPREVLRPIVACRFAIFDQVFAYDLCGIEDELACMLSEFLRLDWTPRDLSRVMFSVGRTKRIMFKNMFKTMLL